MLGFSNQENSKTMFDVFAIKRTSKIMFDVFL